MAGTCAYSLSGSGIDLDNLNEEADKLSGDAYQAFKLLLDATPLETVPVAASSPATTPATSVVAATTSTPAASSSFRIERLLRMELRAGKDVLSFLLR